MARPLDPFVLVGRQVCSWCDHCGRQVTMALIFEDERGFPLLILCIWCPALAISDATGADFVAVLIAFFTNKGRPPTRRAPGWGTDRLPHFWKSPRTR